VVIKFTKWMVDLSFEEEFALKTSTKSRGGARKRK
jgi:hypothetical protein